MRRFSCDEARAHLSDALSGEIGRPEANVLEAHLLDCDPCRSLSELFVWQDRVLSELAGQARLETLMSKVRVGLENLDQVTFEEEGRSRLTLRIPAKWVAAAAAFALAILALLLWKPTAPDTASAQLPAPPVRTNEEPVPNPAPPPANETVREDAPPAPPPETPVQPQPAAVDTRPAPAPALAPKQEPVIHKDPAPPVLTAPAPVIVKGPARADVVQTPKTLDDAVHGGMEFLKARAAAFTRESKADELLLWTYLQGGLGESAPEFQALLRTVLEKKLERTYNVAFTAMVLEDLDRQKYQKRIAQCAQFLLDNQCANGQWSYGEPSMFAEDLVLPPAPPKAKGLRRIPLVRKREAQATGDNSNTMYALLGLRACHDAGILLPRDAVALAAKWWRDTQSHVTGVKPPAVAAEGWCYSRHDHKPYGSMTAGGVGSLVICDYIQGLDWRKDSQVSNGMEWLAKNFSVTFNPGPYEHAGMEENSQHQYYYYLYALERAAILYGTEQIGGHYWYARGLQVILDAQRADGSWKSAGTGSELSDTCFAILFLRKATRALPGVETRDAGSLPKK